MFKASYFKPPPPNLNMNPNREHRKGEGDNVVREKGEVDKVEGDNAGVTSRNWVGSGRGKGW